VQKLAGQDANVRHLPCVLLVPVDLKLDWRSLFPVAAMAPWERSPGSAVTTATGPGRDGPHPLNDVTAVVVTYNSAHCIESLAQSLASWPNVVVVDNGSDDGTQERVNRLLPRARWIGLGRNHGFGAANNLALGQVSTPYALLINPDCLVSTADAQNLLQTARRWPQAAVVVPQLMDGQGRPQINYGWPRQQWTSHGTAAQGPLCVGNACGAVMLLRLDALPAQQWFDTRFFLYYEDEDLCLRLFQAKQAVVVDPAVRVVHVNRGSVRGRHPLRMECLRGKHHAMSKILFTAKHLGAAAARRQRQQARAKAIAALLLRVLLPSPRHLAREWGRVVGFWQASAQY
jgi:GT2 family glycosyltransferase